MKLNVSPHNTIYRLQDREKPLTRKFITFARPSNVSTNTFNFTLRFSTTLGIWPIICTTQQRTFLKFFTNSNHWFAKLKSAAKPKSDSAAWFISLICTLQVFNNHPLFIFEPCLDRKIMTKDQFIQHATP